MAMIGQVAHVEWPYLVEARIDSIATDTVKYFLDKNTQQLTSQLVELEVYNNVKKEMKSASSYLMKKKGIDVGDCKLLVEARLMMGKRFVFCHDLFSLACIVSTRIIIRQNAFHYFFVFFYRYIVSADGSVKLEREYSKHTNFYAGETVVTVSNVYSQLSNGRACYLSQSYKDFRKFFIFEPVCTVESLNSKIFVLIF